MSVGKREAFLLQKRGLDEVSSEDYCIRIPHRIVVKCGEHEMCFFVPDASEAIYILNVFERIVATATHHPRMVDVTLQQFKHVHKIEWIQSNNSNNQNV